jgi:hypothetical protein
VRPKLRLFTEWKDGGSRGFLRPWGFLRRRLHVRSQFTEESGRGDFCAFAGARGVAAILEKTRCEHIKVAAQTETIFSIDNTKDPSAEATLMGGKFYSNVWMKGGQEIADEAIKEK